MPAPKVTPTSAATEAVPCNLCGETRHHRILAERYRLGSDWLDLALVKCASCGLRYTSPRPNARALARLYASDAQHRVSHTYCWSQPAITSRYGPVLDRIQAHAPHGRLLDVGCGAGHFLIAAGSREAWELHGVEPSAGRSLADRPPVRAAIREGTLEAAEYPTDHFAVVTCWYVLEHVPDPRALVAEMERVLAPGGIMAIAVPDYRYLRLVHTGPLSWVLHRRSSRLHLEEHLYHFTLGTMRRLLAEARLEPIHVDMPAPFLVGGPLSHALKRLGHSSLNALRSVTGVQLAGIEVLATRTKS